MNPLTINQEKCNKDGLCVKECPTGVIHMAEENTIPVATDDFKEYCLQCGHCVSVCPTGALSLDWLGPEQCLPIDGALKITGKQAEQFLRSRRSIRTFKDQPVEREKLEKLIQIAGYAPSAKNMQTWNWTVVEDTSALRRFEGMINDWMRSEMERDPVGSEAAYYPRVVKAYENGFGGVSRGAPHIVIAHGDKNWPFGPEDCALAISYLELYAPTLGLGACWGGYFYSATNAYAPLFEALGIPAKHRAYGAVMVGYPQFKYQRLPERNQPNVSWI